MNVTIHVYLLALAVRVPLNPSTKAGLMQNNVWNSGTTAVSHLHEEEFWQWQILRMTHVSNGQGLWSLMPVMSDTPDRYW